jgi:hypothetical protein
VASGTQFSFIFSASFTAIKNILPVLFPFLSPGKRLLAGLADACGKKRLLVWHDNITRMPVKEFIAYPIL